MGNTSSFTESSTAVLNSAVDTLSKMFKDGMSVITNNPITSLLAVVCLFLPMAFMKNPPKAPVIPPQEQLMQQMQKNDLMDDYLTLGSKKNRAGKVKIGRKAKNISGMGGEPMFKNMQPVNPYPDSMQAKANVNKFERLVATNNDSSALKYALVAGASLFVLFVSKTALNTQTALDAISYLKSTSSYQSMTTLLTEMYQYVMKMLNLKTAEEEPTGFFSNVFYQSVGVVAFVPNSIFSSLSGLFSNTRVEELVKSIGPKTVKDYKVAIESLKNDTAPTFTYNVIASAMKDSLSAEDFTKRFETTKQETINYLERIIQLNGGSDDAIPKIIPASIPYVEQVFRDKVTYDPDIPWTTKVLAAAKTLSNQVYAIMYNVYSLTFGSSNNNIKAISYLGSFLAVGFIVYYLSNLASRWYSTPARAAPNQSIASTTTAKRTDYRKMDILGSVTSVTNTMIKLNNSIITKKPSLEDIKWSYKRQNRMYEFGELFERKLSNMKILSTSSLIELIDYTLKAIKNNVKRLEDEEGGIFDSNFNGPYQNLLSEISQIKKNLMKPRAKMTVMDLIQMPRLAY